MPCPPAVGLFDPNGRCSFHPRQRKYSGGPSVGALDPVDVVCAGVLGLDDAEPSALNRAKGDNLGVRDQGLWAALLPTALAMDRKDPQRSMRALPRRADRWAP